MFPGDVFDVACALPQTAVPVVGSLQNLNYTLMLYMAGCWP